MRKWQEVLKISSFFEGKKGIDLLRQMPSFVQPVHQNMKLRDLIL